MIRLSIIVPFYNVEKYIEQCIRSLYDQDIPQEEYEVICVDDCSPDGSRAIVERLQKEYPTLRLICHERNKRVGAARNTGLRAAVGYYIWFVDSDDLIKPKCLGELMNICELNDVDVLLFGYKEYRNNILSETNYRVWNNNGIEKGITFWRNQVVHRLKDIGAVWTFIVKKSLIVDNNIQFPEINMGEDVPFAYEVLLRANRLISSDQAYYYYRVFNDSVTQQYYHQPTPDLIYENFVDCCLALDRVSKLKNDKSVYNSIQGVIRYIIKSGFCSIGKMSVENQKRLILRLRSLGVRNIKLLGWMHRTDKIKYLRMLIKC